MRVYVATPPTISEFTLEAAVWPVTVARRKPPTFECPFGVIFGLRAAQSGCPLFPNEPTWSARQLTSEKCQNRTHSLRECSEVLAVNLGSTDWERVEGRVLDMAG